MGPEPSACIRPRAMATRTSISDIGAQNSVDRRAAARGCLSGSWRPEPPFRRRSGGRFGPFRRVRPAPTNGSPARSAAPARSEPAATSTAKTELPSSSAATAWSGATAACVATVAACGGSSSSWISSAGGGEGCQLSAGAGAGTCSCREPTADSHLNSVFACDLGQEFLKAGIVTQAVQIGI